MKRSWTHRFIRVMACVAAGGTLLQTSCSVQLQNALVSTFADFLSQYLAALLQQLIPTASA